MNEKKLQELLAEVLNGLTDEQKEQAVACKDENELIALLGKMGAEVPDELLDAVSGGFFLSPDSGSSSRGIRIRER